MSRVKSLKRKLISSIKRDYKIIPVITPVEDCSYLKGKTALITGGTGGIGLAVAEELARYGCRIIVAGTNERKLGRISKEHSESGWSVAKIDYGQIESLRTQIENAVKPVDTIDYFISSVGVHTKNPDYFNLDAAEYDRVMDINLKGTYFAAKIVANIMIDNHMPGRMVFVSSSRGLEPAWSPYGISKWGINGMTMGLAQVLSEYGISVNAVAPGTTATQLIEYTEGQGIESTENRFGRMATPEEVAHLIRVLLIEGSDLISGEVISLSGGRGRFDFR